MGTNFFLILPTYERSASTFDEFHIGKRSGAGGGLCSFMLQGHREGLDGPIMTWDHWRRIIESASRIRGATVADEYSDEHDPLEFIAEVEGTAPEHRRRQYDWIRDHGWGHVWPEGSLPPLDFRGDWLCPSGFSFTFTEFS